MRRLSDLVTLFREAWPVAAERLGGPVTWADLLPLVRGTLDAKADGVTADHVRVLLDAAATIARDPARP
jgi:hypothetical protein